MSERLPRTRLTDVHIEVATTKVRGRTAHMHIEADAPDALGYITLEERNPGQILLVLNTRNGKGRAYATLEAATVQKLKGLLP